MDVLQSYSYNKNDKVKWLNYDQAPGNDIIQPAKFA